MNTHQENQKCKMQHLNSEISDDGTWLQQRTSPLFVELVLENILTNLKGHNNSIVLGGFRLVCKFWDKEITKMIRRDTFTNLKYILLPYPEGMGWTANRKEKSFEYKAPNPEVRTFENVKLTVNYHENFPFKRKELSKWFIMMGFQVKRLCFESTLNKKDERCYTILEKILKEWCPNLQSLTFECVRVFDSLIFSSGFKNTTKEIVCTGLKDVKICVKSTSNDRLRNSINIPNILRKSHALNNFIHQFGLPAYSRGFPEFKNHSGTIIKIPSELFQKSEFPDISQFIPEDYFPKLLDGGIFGQILSCTSVEKFSLVGTTIPKNIRYLAAFFHYRKNSWRTSLKHLELELVHGKSISRDLVVFGKLGCPITTLKFNQDLDRENPDVTIENILRFIECFAQTLQYLEYSGKFNRHNWRTRLFLLPELPKLKVFVYKNSSDHELCSINIIKNLPCLEILHLTVYPKIYSTGTFFGIDTGNLMNDQLKELKITGTLSGTEEYELSEWFPNVTRVELELRDTNEDIIKLLEHLENLQLEHLNLTWIRARGQVRSPMVNTELIWEISKLKYLKTLEMKFDHTTEPFCVLLSAFSEGFGVLPELRVLKLTNFGVFRDDFAEIKICLDFIPVKQFVNLSFHGLSFYM